MTYTRDMIIGTPRSINMVRMRTVRLFYKVHVGTFREGTWI